MLGATELLDVDGDGALDDVDGDGALLVLGAGALEDVDCLTQLAKTPAVDNTNNANNILDFFIINSSLVY